MYVRLFFQIFLSISLLFSCFVKAEYRRIRCTVYPDFENADDNLNLVHITASGDQDVIHYVWSTYSRPSVIVAQTTKDTNLTIDFQKIRLFQKGAISFTVNPIASTGFTISELWENLYDSDTSEVYDVKSVVPLDLDSFYWHNITNSSVTCSDQFAQVNLVSSSSDEVFSKDGTFGVQFSVSASQTAAAEYPHLIYTGNSTQIKVAFDKFYSNSSRVRYGMEISVFAPVAQKCSQEECQAIVTKSVSDEFSPGIFSDIELLPKCSQNSFLSWRPVAYTSKEPSVANSADAKISSKCSASVISSAKSIAELFFEDQTNYTVSAFNMTFGTTGDGFYPKTEYTSWSLMAGVGSSVGFKLSVSAIIIGSIGMGALLLFLFSGLIFIGVQKCRRKKDDELLLGTNTIN